MTASVRYYGVLLLRSQRWLPPVLLYVALVGTSLDGQSRLGSQFGWNAAMPVPALAWLTRSLSAAEPPAARACLSAATGARRPQYAALAVPLAAGLLPMLLAAVAALLTCTAPPGASPAAAFGAGLATGAVCALTGSALGAVCSPPLVRTTAGGAGVSTVGSVLLLMLTASPANAAVRDAFSSHRTGARLPLLPLLAARALAAVLWWTSARAAGRVGAAADRDSG
ncbi:hypothetical protein [Streptomyces minutiscleroticus]|uniref:ABC transporter n=1 Tax=Streptomyces minutiscleroticus TaxID=68238 RepID=A0A918NGM3_9ACTN|nr:hypothetical protein [Streptomyces minutiscleroticus]GGX66041.1 hypothetical protein GCM10010358_20520 [Streptomyces minutiscleroticus]